VHANDVAQTPPVTLESAECVGTSCQVDHDGRSAILFRFATPLPPNGRVRLRVRLRGNLEHLDPARTGMMAQAMESMQRLSSGSGLHGNYGLLAESDGVASLGNFYATLAPRRDDAWVTREDSTMGDLGAGRIAHFRARLVCAQGSRVAASGAVVREETRLGQGGAAGEHEVEVVSGLSRNFALVVSPRFHAVEQRVGAVTVRSWYLPEDRADAERVLADAAAALGIFERRFGRYPYRDLDLVEAPLVGGAGGVEFSGLVTLAKMFYGSGGGMGLGAIGPMLAGGRQGQVGMRESMLEFVVAHEVAHQWWHGLVGSDARRHPFVDESLAQFSSIQYVRDRYGEERARREARRQVAANYHTMRLAGASDGAVDRPVAAFGSEMAYAGLVYGKGAFAYEKVREKVGDESFFRHVRSYVDRHRFGEAPPRALFDLMATGRHEQDVRALERRWLDESHGDEDLGPPDLAGMLGEWMPDGSLDNLGGLMEQMLRGLNGGGGAGGLPSLPGIGPSGPAGQPNVDGDQALQDAMRLLQQLGR
ncbi:MAG: hypothetical protein KC586_07245, partial [Myxococcales bacterium]|nr:hypothetical protein [Myxococcales bacterium]